MVHMSDRLGQGHTLAGAAMHGFFDTVCRVSLWVCGGAGEVIRSPDARPPRRPLEGPDPVGQNRDPIDAAPHAVAKSG